MSKDLELPEAREGVRVFVISRAIRLIQAAQGMEAKKAEEEKCLKRLSAGQDSDAHIAYFQLCLQALRKHENGGQELAEPLTEAESIATERAEAEAAAEAERIAKERADADAVIEAERIAIEKAEAEVAAETERIAREEAEAAAEAERIAREKADMLQLEQERIATEMAERNRHPFIEDATSGDPVQVQSETIFRITYMRKVDVNGSSCKEILSYGASDEIENLEGFKNMIREDSHFKNKVLELESVQSLNVWAAAEYVPKSWTKIDIALYHLYHDTFDLADARLCIKVASQSVGEGLKEDTSWKVVYNEEFPTDDGKETERVIREKVATVTIPDEITDLGHYGIKLEIYENGQDWKRGWSFEGFGVVEHI